MQSTRYLAPGGLLVFIVSQRRLEVSARYLASHYDPMTCYRFHDPEYAAFGQVVLFATKKAEPSQDHAAEGQAKTFSVMHLAPLPADAEPRFSVPSGEPGAVLFSTRSLDIEAAVAEARRNGLWASPLLRDKLWPKDVGITRPLMPLRKGHLAMLIAAGFLNNLCLEADGQRVLVKGRTYKEFILAETTEETEVHREVLRTSVVALRLESGEFMDIHA